MPVEMTLQDICEVIAAFAAAAQRADEAGFDWIEVHAAHGYLPHCFYSPLSNLRSDGYGGSFEKRVRLTREIAQAIRAVWPERKVLAVRISYTEWLEGGWNLEDAIQLSRLLKSDGVDLIDVSSGGNSASTVALARYLAADKLGTPGAAELDEEMIARIPIGPGYQVPGAVAVKHGADIPVAAVGLIADAVQADDLIREGKADKVMLARALLRNPYWPLQAAVELEATGRARVPVQYYLAWKDLGIFKHQPVSAPIIG